MAKRRVLERLKHVDGATVGELARSLELTDMAVRLHLRDLQSKGWVEPVRLAAKEKINDGPKGGSQDNAGKRGRPAQTWRLTAAADAQFEDRHADLTLDLIAAVRQAVGEVGLGKVIAARAEKQVETYRRRVGRGGTDGSNLEHRVRQLGAIRTEEGYRAEVQADGDGWLLIEHHCPICDAAKACAGLCRSELEVFQAALGPGATVARVKHLLSGDRRCSYRINPSVDRD